MPKLASFKEQSRYDASQSSLEYCKRICSPDQIEALKAIASCSSNGPPILVSGPFGTGKTYIQAVVAHILFHESILNNKINVFIFWYVYIINTHWASFWRYLKVSQIFSTQWRCFNIPCLRLWKRE